MAEKVTTMVLKVDLQCRHCRKKIKKILCKFPQIRDQIYDEKQNTVTIKVVCCSPEKIRDKLCCKGGKTIKSIDILPPPKPKPSDPTKKPEPPPKALEAAPPPANPPKKTESLPKAPELAIGKCCGPCYEGRVGGSCYHRYGVPPPPPPGRCYDSYGGYGRGYCVSRGDCFSDENPLACTIM